MDVSKLILSFGAFMLGGGICDALLARGVSDPFIFMMIGAGIAMLLDRIKFVKE